MPLRVQPVGVEAAVAGAQNRFQPALREASSARLDGRCVAFEAKGIISAAAGRT